MNENNFSVIVSIADEKLAAIMRRIDEAQEELYKCYQELRELGILRIEKSAASGN